MQNVREGPDSTVVTDVYVAAYLRVRGHHYTKDRVGNLVRFIFNRDAFHDISSFYDNSQNTVSVSEYVESLKSVKNDLYQTKKEISRNGENAKGRSK